MERFRKIVVDNATYQCKHFYIQNKQVTEEEWNQKQL